MRIALIHPSRGRPRQALEAAEHWLTRASNILWIEYILSIDNDDPCRDDYYKCFGESLVLPKNSFSKIFAGNNASCIQAINSASRHFNNPDVYVVMSDDFRCPENWDDLIVKAAGSNTDWIMKTDDGTQPWIITLPIMSREYYQRFGGVYNPDYKHMFCDTEMTHIATLLDKVIDARDLKFPHLHYSTGATEKDDLNERNNATWEQGEELYLSRVGINFGLIPEDIKGKVTDKQTLQWLKSKGIQI